MNENNQQKGTEMSKLVIIESPGKAGTIKGYLGSGYKVVASVGHVKDLPKSTLGVDIENGFKAKYVNIRDKSELINSLKKEVKQADEIFLATDPDREGEAIAWHLATALECDEAKTSRVTYNELTKEAVRRAIENPGKINMNLVDSQQARRILDRIVGYKLSPFLWKTVKSGLSEAMCDRLKLTQARIDGIAAAMEKLIALPDPLGISSGWRRPNGLYISKETVPLGTVGIIYEARPNVTVDAASLCLKSGNTVILRGGKEAFESNKILSFIT